MPRCRLRLLLQELDLPLGITTIGRGVECHVSLDDPLVSRRHARIIVGADRAVVEDLESRNGVLLNGRAIQGPTRLRDGDRLCIGTQQVVFCEADTGGTFPPPRLTGRLRFCARCRLPYPGELVSCPACEHTERIDELDVVNEDTSPDILSPESARASTRCYPPAAPRSEP